MMLKSPGFYRGFFVEIWFWCLATVGLASTFSLFEGRGQCLRKKNQAAQFQTA